MADPENETELKASCPLVFCWSLREDTGENQTFVEEAVLLESTRAAEMRGSWEASITGREIVPVSVDCFEPKETIDVLSPTPDGSKWVSQFVSSRHEYGVSREDLYRIASNHIQLRLRPRCAVEFPVMIGCRQEARLSKIGIVFETSKASLDSLPDAQAHIAFHREYNREYMRMATAYLGVPATHAFNKKEDMLLRLKHLAEKTLLRHGMFLPASVYYQGEHVPIVLQVGRRVVFSKNIRYRGTIWLSSAPLALRQGAELFRSVTWSCGKLSGTLEGTIGTVVSVT